MNEQSKEYVSKPLTEEEIKSVYRNEFYRIDSNRYFGCYKRNRTKKHNRKEKTR